MVTVTSCNQYTLYKSALKNKKSPTRVVKNYEIELLQSDDIEMSINGNFYHFANGSLLICKPGDIRYSTHPFKCYFIHLQPLNLDPLIKDFIDSIPLNTVLIDVSKYIDLFFKVQKHFEKNNQSEQFYLCSKIYELFHFLQKDAITPSSLTLYSENEKALMQAKKFISQNFRQQITLKDIAQSVFLSPNYLHNIFTTFFKKTPRAYLEELRIDEAKRLLKLSTLTILKKKEKTGFSSQTYFEYVFKKNVGMSPSKYRKPTTIL